MTATPLPASLLCACELVLRTVRAEFEAEGRAPIIAYGVDSAPRRSDAEEGLAARRAVRGGA